MGVNGGKEKCYGCRKHCPKNLLVIIKDSIWIGNVEKFMLIKKISLVMVKNKKVPRQRMSCETC